MGYEALFWMTLVLTLGSIHFSRREVVRWRRMLASNVILLGLCAFSGAMAFFPGAPGFILGIAGLLPASVASMQLTRETRKKALRPRRSFHLEIEHRQISPGQALLDEHDRIDQANKSRRLGRRWMAAFLPALAMGATAINFGSWLMGGMAFGVAAVSAWAVQPAFVNRLALPPAGTETQLPPASRR